MPFLLYAFTSMHARATSLFPSGFVHANIGPAQTRVGMLLLEIDREVKSVTNLSMRSLDASRIALHEHI